MQPVAHPRASMLGVVAFPEYGGEERGKHGGLRGRGRILLPQLDAILEIFHYASPVIRTWDSVARQELYAWVRTGNAWIGGAYFTRPGGPHAETLEHDRIWQSEQTFILEGYRKKGVAMTLYAYLSQLNYWIMPSQNVSDLGDAFWERLDPGLLSRIDSNKEPLIEADFSESSLSSITARFGAPLDTNKHQAFSLSNKVDILRSAFVDWP